MFSVVAFAVVLQATVSILCEQTVSDSTEFQTTSKFSVLLKDSIVNVT